MSYILYHLLISRGEYREYKRRGLYDHPGSGLSLERAALDTRRVRALIAGVGGPWGWDRRAQYGSDAAVQRILDRPGAALFIFRAGGAEIGYCLAHDEDIDLASNFNETAAAGEPLKIARIEEFGFLPEHTGRGYGRFFLPALFEILFRGHGYTYLTSRGTNHPGVVPFYQSLGMRLVRREKKPDDDLSPGAYIG